MTSALSTALTNLAKDSAYKAIKRELVRKMWSFAAEQNDELIMSPYYTVALAPWGPADALRPEKEKEA